MGSGCLSVTIEGLGTAEVEDENTALGGYVCNAQIMLTDQPSANPELAFDIVSFDPDQGTLVVKAK